MTRRKAESQPLEQSGALPKPKEPGGGQRKGLDVARVTDAAMSQPARAIEHMLETHNHALRAASEGPGMAAARVVEAQVQAAAKGPGMAAARAVHQIGAALNEPTAAFARNLVAQERALRDAMEGPARQLQAIIDDSTLYASHLRDQAATQEAVRLAIQPSAETRAAWAIQSQLPELVEISAKTSEQIGALATVAKAGLEESTHLRDTMEAFSKDAKRSGDRLTWLTVAIVILTALLFWEALGLWPLIHSAAG